MSQLDLYRRRDMAAFDVLPPRIREAINNSPLPIPLGSCLRVLQLIRQHGEDKVLAALVEAQQRVVDASRP